VVLNGITGSLGLEPTLAALESGATLALANKESLIVGGSLVTSAKVRGDQIVPVDSEHSALAQALMAGTKAEVGQTHRDRERWAISGTLQDVPSGGDPSGSPRSPHLEYGPCGDHEFGNAREQRARGDRSTPVI